MELALTAVLVLTGLCAIVYAGLRRKPAKPAAGSSGDGGAPLPAASHKQGDEPGSTDGGSDGGGGGGGD